jgi:hypothetical protein
MRPLLKPALLAVAAALALSACATATPYAPAGPGSRYGYSEQRVDADRYRVTFAGNSVTSREQVEMALLLRAAEITSQNGYDWFATVNRATDRDVRVQRAFDPFYYDRYGPFWGPEWRYYRRGLWSPWGDPFGRDFDVREIDRYEASAEIVMGRGAKPVGDPNAFDAREVVANLSGRVTRPAG